MEAGKYKSSDRVLPTLPSESSLLLVEVSRHKCAVDSLYLCVYSLPPPPRSLFPFSLAIDNVLSILGRTNSESVLKSRLKTINDYCDVSHTTLM